MPRIDGYPSAGPLTGDEVLPGMQGGITKSIPVDQLTTHMQALLEPVIAQMIADAIAGVIIAPDPNTSAALSDSAGILLADDAGVLLLAA